ncbi:MAG: adenylate/guanylate cyclase domain-containing protein [Pseudomonadota bacterium]
MNYSLRRPRGLKIGVLAGSVVCILGLASVSRATWYEALRERAFDAAMSIGLALPASQAVVVVDIDRPSLHAIGDWPWSRQQLAGLVAGIAAAKPKVLGIDILISGKGGHSPAALAQRTEAFTDHDAAGRPSHELDDGDEQLANAVRGLPTVLGFALDPEHDGRVSSATPILIQGRLELPDLWRARGAISPNPRLAVAASGLGVLALPGDADGNIRRLPLLARSGDQLIPGFAIEIVRVASGASALFASANPQALRAGDTSMPLGIDGMLRLLVAKPDRWPSRTVPAAALLRSAAETGSLANRIVLLGSSAPEVGGLRTIGSGLLAPSVQLHADAVEQILAGLAPRRPEWFSTLELLNSLLLGAIVTLATLTLGPALGGLALATTCLGWMIAAVVAVRTGPYLLDPIVVPALVTASFMVASLIVAVDTRRREATIRRRFEQHLAPAIVHRIVEEPGLLKLEGELREVTSLFTDIEGFTSMTDRSDPRALVRALDNYLDGVTRIVIEHGGMIDKIVGDGVRALFNAPLDLAEHPARAIACAKAIIAFTERFRMTPEAAALQFGKTRIGIETGTAIIGDVGGGRKLDYTAHGNTINTAARLEAANKQLGSSICVGPGTAGRVDASLLRPLGRISVRGRNDDIAVYDCWPESFDSRDRDDFRAAMAVAEERPAVAAAMIRALGERIVGDPVLPRLAERLGELECGLPAAPDGGAPRHAPSPHPASPTIT